MMVATSLAGATSVFPGGAAVVPLVRVQSAAVAQSAFASVFQEKVDTRLPRVIYCNIHF
jgi:hypothetical protein